MERDFRMQIDSMYGSRFVEEEEYYSNKVIRIEIVFHCRDFNIPPHPPRTTSTTTSAHAGTVPRVMEKSYGCYKTFFVDRDEIVSSLPHLMSQLVEDEGVDGLSVVLGDNENERRNVFEKINAIAQSLPKPMVVEGMRIAAELFIRINVERWKMPRVAASTSAC